MEPWTDGAALIFKSELTQTSNSEGEPWTDGAPLILKSELIQTLNSEDGALDDGAPDSLNLNSYTDLELRGLCLGLMGRPCFLNQNSYRP